MIARGIAGLQQHSELSGLTQAQLLNGVRQHMTGDIWQTIDNVEWRYDERARASILTISGTGLVAWEDDGDGAKSLTLPGGGFNPPQRRIRPPEQNQSLPYYNEPVFSCHVTTVRLPGSTRPNQWSFNSSFETRIFGRTYYRAFDLRDQAIRMVRGTRIEVREFDAGAASRDNGRIARFDNSMAQIYFDPRPRREASAAAARVPATFEIDWTADRVPCLPASAGGSGPRVVADRD